MSLDSVLVYVVSHLSRLLKFQSSGSLALFAFAAVFSSRLSAFYAIELTFFARGGLECENASGEVASDNVEANVIDGEDAARIESSLKDLKERGREPKKRKC